MYYSRSTLEEDKPFKKEEAITNILVNALLKGEKLTIAESKYICSKLKYMKSPKDGKPLFDDENFDQCAIPVFIDKYLNYRHNVDGWNEELDFLKRPIPLEQRKQDAALLNEHFKNWEKFITGKPAKTLLFREVQVETNRQIKKLSEYCKNALLGHNRYLYLRKSLILHSKFLYLTVNGYFEESGTKEKTVTICGHRLIMDAHAYVHILFRHFAAAIKEYQQDKSYHFANFDHRALPESIFEVIKSYSQVIDCSQFDEEKIFFRLNGTLYALWWKAVPYKGKQDDIVYMIKSLYPVKENRDLDKIARMTEMRFSAALSFLSDRVTMATH